MEVKFILDCVKWFDKVNGNTYFGARITRCSDGKTLAIPFQYGYGNHFEDITIRSMIKNEWIIPLNSDGEPHNYEKDGPYYCIWPSIYGIHVNERHGLKREAVNIGKENPATV